MILLGDTVELTYDQFYDYIIYQNNKLNMTANDIPTFINPEESVHIKAAMKLTLPDFLDTLPHLSRMDITYLAQSIATVLVDPSVKQLTDNVLGDLFKHKIESWHN